MLDKWPVQAIPHVDPGTRSISTIGKTELVWRRTFGLVPRQFFFKHWKKANEPIGARITPYPMWWLKYHHNSSTLPRMYPCFMKRLSTHSIHSGITAQMTLYTRPVMPSISDDFLLLIRHTLSETSDLSNTGGSANTSTNGGVTKLGNNVPNKTTTLSPHPEVIVVELVRNACSPEYWTHQSGPHGIVSRIASWILFSLLLKLSSLLRDFCVSLCKKGTQLNAKSSALVRPAPWNHFLRRLI